MMYLAIVYLILIITSFIGLQVSSISADHDRSQVYIVLTTSKPTATSQIQHNLAILDSLNDDHDDVNGVGPTHHNMVIHHYSEALHGFSAWMSIQQSESLRQLEEVIEVYEDTTYNLHTTHSPQFLGLNINPINLGHHTSTLQEQLYNASQDVIIGVLDTGVWPESPSFYDHNMSSIPSRWKGGCDKAAKFCNKKLIGARGFIKGINASARDSVGHGTHTASTAAGDLVPGANLFGYAPGIAQGMAPGARLATYRVCNENGCKGSDVLAGIDAAVGDGVDVLSISLGAPANNTIDLIGIVTFRAMERGIFVSCSAGNDGPAQESMSNGAPWIMTVGAGTMDRDFPAYVTLEDGTNYTGESLYSGKGMGEKPVELVYGGNDTSSALCLPDSLNSSAVKGKVVICDKGITPRMAKGMVVKAAGGVGMILVNTEKDGRQLLADSHLLPAVAVTYKDGAKIKTFAASKNHVKVLLTFGGTVMNVRPAPQVTAFSSRGPYKAMPEVLKPDVIGPGLNILAAWPEAISPSGVDGDYRKTQFNIVSGTSMSCPHISGLAALLKAAHPNWSPSAIKSALMTTANTLDNTGSPILDMADNSIATPWALGAGHVDILKAMSPGFVYDSKPADHIAFLCSLGIDDAHLRILSKGKNSRCPTEKKLLDPGQLNYPSFSVFFNRSIQVVKQSRVVTNVGSPNSIYHVSVVAPPNVEVTVKPSKLVFEKASDKQNYTMTFNSKKSVKDLSAMFSFGSITWVMKGEKQVRSPIAFYWS